MAIGHTLTKESIRLLERNLRERPTSSPPALPLRGNYGPRPYWAHRIGKSTSTIPARVSMDQAGVGTVKWDKLNTDTAQFSDVDPEETTVYNVTPNAIASGQRVIGFADPTGKKNDKGQLVFYVAGVPDGTTVDLVHFELTADLNLSGSTSAKVLVYNSPNWDLGAEDITVFDWVGGFGAFEAKIGDRGIGVRRPGQAANVDIIHIEEAAIFVEIELQEDIAASLADASVADFYQGYNPGSPQEVADTRALFPHALNTCLGIAARDDQQEKYHLIACDQMAILFRCVASQNFDVDTDPVAVTAPFSKLTFPPYGKAPAAFPSTVKNSLKQRGRNGDPVLIAWDESQSDWILVQGTSAGGAGGNDPALSLHGGGQTLTTGPPVIPAQTITLATAYTNEGSFWVSSPGSNAIRLKRVAYYEIGYHLTVYAGTTSASGLLACATAVEWFSFNADIWDLSPLAVIPDTGSQGNVLAICDFTGVAHVSQRRVFANPSTDNDIILRLSGQLASLVTDDPPSLHCYVGAATLWAKYLGV